MKNATFSTEIPAALSKAIESALTNLKLNDALIEDTTDLLKKYKHECSSAAELSYLKMYTEVLTRELDGEFNTMKMLVLEDFFKYFVEQIDKQME